LENGEEELLGLPVIDALLYWDVRAVELVSPPLPAPPSYSSDGTRLDSTSLLLQECLQHLSPKITATSRKFVLQDPARNRMDEASFITLTNDQCGFHVHVGVDPMHDKTGDLDCSIPLPVLQQFAMLQLRFEPIFAQLHSPNRRGSKYCLSNTIAFLTDDHVCKKQRLKSGEDIRAFVFDPNLTAQELAWRMGSEDPIPCTRAKAQVSDLSERLTVDQVDGPNGRDSCESQIKQTLRSDTNDDQDSGCDVSRIFDSDGGDRYRIVNWSNLCRSKSEGPQTLEFRQADGTLDLRDVVHWVHLITATIRTCECLSYSPDPQSIWSNWEVTAPTLTELLNLLGVRDVTIRTYWEKRVQKHADRIDEFVPELKDWDVCSVCALQRDGRLLNRKKRAELTRGYRHVGHLKRKQKSTAKQRQRDRSRRAEERRNSAGTGPEEADGAWSDQPVAAGTGSESEDIWNAGDEASKPPDCEW
jgi:hypothetical protein